MLTLATALTAASCVAGNENCQDTGLPGIVVVSAALLVIVLVLWINWTARDR